MQHIGKFLIVSGIWINSENMGIRILLSNALSEDRSSIQCEVEPGEKVSGIIETAVGYWGLDKEKKYGVKCGTNIMQPEIVITDSIINDGAKLVVIDSIQWQADLEKVKNWIAENLDATQEELELVKSSEKSSNLTEFLIKNTQKANRHYMIIFKDGAVDSYRPL